MDIETSKNTLIEFSKKANQVLSDEFINQKNLQLFDVNYPKYTEHKKLWIIILGITVFIALLTSWWLLLAGIYFIYKIFILHLSEKTYLAQIQMGLMLYEGDSGQKDFPSKCIVSNHVEQNSITPFTRRHYKHMLGVQSGDVLLYVKKNHPTPNGIISYFPLKKKGEMIVYRWSNGKYTENGRVKEASPEIVNLATEFIAMTNLWWKTTVKMAEENDSNKFNALREASHRDENYIARLWEKVHLPQATKQNIIQLGESFAKSQPQAARGILLYGPPGTGKSLIARTLSQTLECGFISVNLHDLKGKHIGESAQKVKDIWNQARSHKRCILFIDECESVFVKRGSLASDSFTDDIVQSFIAEWDGFSQQNSVLVLGATNRKDIMDEAVLLRFAEKIEIPLPDAETRVAILKSELSKNGKSATLPPETANALQGFSGRDIANLANKMLRSGKPIDSKLIAELTEHKRTESNIGVDRNATWDRLILPLQKKQELVAVSTMLKQSEALQKKNITIPRGILLYGPPGTGKTQIARTMANESGLSFVGVSTADMKAGYTGQSGKLVQEVFARARSQAPCILFIDEMDIIAPGRNSSLQDHFTTEIVGQLLQEMDGVISHSQKVFILAATNHREKIDSAILSRFNNQIEIGLPADAERLEILRVMLKDKPLNFVLEMHLPQLAHLSEGASGRDLRSWVENAEQRALMNQLATGSIEEVAIRLEDLLQTVSGIQKRV